MIRLCSLILVTCFLFWSSKARGQSLTQITNTSDSFYNAGQFDSSLRYAQKAAEIIKSDSGEYSRPYAYFLGQYFGMIYQQLDDITKEVYWYRESIRIFENMHDTLSTEYAETVTNYAELITGFGSFNDALPYLLKAEVILRPYANQLNSYGGAVNNLANVYSYSGSYAKAESLYNNMLDLVKKVLTTDENEYGAKLYSNLGIVYNKTSQWNKSEINFIKAGQIVKKLNAGKAVYYTILFNLGQVYAAEKKTPEATKIFLEMIDSLPATKYVVLHASALNGMGQVRELEHKRKESEGYYLAALKILQQDERGARIYNAVGSNLAYLYAQNNLSKADSLYRVLLQNFAAAGDRDQYNYLQTYTGFCTNLVKSGKLAEAADSLQSLSQNLFRAILTNFDGMPQDEKIKFSESLKANFDLAYSLLAAGETSPSLVRLGLQNLIRLKGMVLSAQTGLYNEVRHSSDTSLLAVYRNWLNVRQMLYHQYSLQKTNRNLNTDSLEKMSESYERQFSAAFSIGLPKYESALTENIGNHLAPDEAAVDFVRFNFLTGAKSEIMYGAFVIKPGENDPHFVVLCREQQLKQLFKPAKGKIADVNDQMKKIYQTGDLSLYTILWKPLDRYVSNIRTIFYSPAGMINSIALQAVYCGNKSILMDRHNFYLKADFGELSNKDDTLPLKTDAVNIWGNMDYSKEVYLNLPPAKKEDDNVKKERTVFLADQVKGGGFRTYWDKLNNIETDTLAIVFTNKKIPFKTFKKIQATEDTFKMVADGSKGILHISTHGFFTPADTAGNFSNKMFTSHINPLLRCGLVFSGANYVSSGKEPLPGKDDGILTGYEIAQLDLSHVDLAVLSACETGLGDLSAGEEGVMGLQRAFRLAGVKKLVVSLWRVPEKETADLMFLFYNKLLGGTKASDALLQSQQELSKHSLPYYWAGFVLIE